jgi:hypothetical protein
MPRSYTVHWFFKLFAFLNLAGDPLAVSSLAKAREGRASFVSWLWRNRAFL